MTFLQATSVMATEFPIDIKEDCLSLNSKVRRIGLWTKKATPLAVVKIRLFSGRLETKV